MKLELEKALDFKKSIQAISVLIDEAEFIVTNEGLKLKATDPSQISLVDFFMPRKAFKSFELNKEERKLGLDLDYLNQVMARARADDSLILTLGLDETTLHLVFHGKNTRDFSIPLLDLTKASIPTPKIDFEAELQIEANLLQDALKDAALLSSHVKLGVENNSFFVRAESSKGTLNSETKANSLKSLKAIKNVKAMFPLDYLNDMLKTADSNTIITVKLRTDAPVELSYNIGNSSIVYYLAPRIEE
jgi:proliferating cell nuclear antigen